MNDIGRHRICEDIAKRYPYSQDVVYEIYEAIREHATKKKIVITFADQIKNTETILNAASVFGISPFSVYLALINLSLDGVSRQFRFNKT